MRMQVDVCSKQPKKGIHPTHEVENKKFHCTRSDRYNIRIVMPGYDAPIRLT